MLVPVFQIKLMCAKYCTGSGDDCKLYQRRIRLDIRKTFLEREVMQWHSSTGRWWVSVPGESHGDVALREDMVSGQYWLL